MPKPTVAEVKAGIDVIVQNPKFAQNWKDVSVEKIFNSLMGELKKWLENNECGELVESRDGQLVASVIKTFFADKFAFGSKNKRIGTFDYNTVPQAVTPQPSGPPVYTNLDDSWAANKGKYTVVRRDVARVLGIDDKTHSHHGSNFSGTQTLKQIISNVFATVQGDQQQNTIRVLIRQKYGFDA
jgi:hypothetical protein